MRRPFRRSIELAAVAIVAAVSPVASQKYAVHLKLAWAKKFADLATIPAAMTVKHPHQSANAIGSDGQDGDMHFSGVSADVGLPFVAEIVNAKLPNQAAAVAAMKAKAASGGPLAVTGAWRLWFEHPSASQTQGGNNPFLPDNTNPNHSFEIHPVSRVEQNDVTTSFITIPGYTPYTADVAFPYFDSIKATIKASTSALTIQSEKLKYNYVGFDIELTHAPKKVSDGYIALATVLKGKGDDPAANGVRRMIFVAGTPAAEKIKQASSGDRFHVLGIPRINLNAVLALAAKHGAAQFPAFLPYEMIIVGVD